LAEEKAALKVCNISKKKINNNKRLVSVFQTETKLHTFTIQGLFTIVNESFHVYCDFQKQLEYIFLKPQGGQKVCGWDKFCNAYQYGLHGLDCRNFTNQLESLVVSVCTTVNTTAQTTSQIFKKGLHVKQ